MLPRHVRRASAYTAHAVRHHHRLVAPTVPSPFRTVSSISSTSTSSFHPSTRPQSSRAGFHTSARRSDELPKSPFQTFVDVLKDELQKNRDLQQNVKQLQGDVDKLQDSEAMKRARAAYERARLISSIKENPKLRAAADELRKGGVVVGDAVSEALKSMEESELMRAISRASSAVSNKIAESTEPIRNTEAYKTLAETVMDALDDSGSAKHAGFEEKEARRARRQARLAKAGKQGGIAARGRTHADPDAGSSLVVHKDSPRQERWNRLKETNPILRSFASFQSSVGSYITESENPVIGTLRSTSESVRGWLFDETEVAQVTRMMRTMDPMFDRESFERDLREYIIPEVVDAYLTADKPALIKWCSEATYNVLWATMEQYLKQGLVSDSKVLDIRQVDITTAKVLETNAVPIPVYVVTFATQEILLFRNAKTRNIVVGAEDRVEQCNYAAVITRVEAELDDELTGGWKIVEMARRSARAYL